MSKHPKRLISLVLSFGLTFALATPVSAGGMVDQTISGLDALTDRAEHVIERSERWMNAGWDAEVAAALDLASLNRLEQSLAVAQVDAAEVLDPLIGPVSTSDVPATITTVLLTQGMDPSQRTDLTETLAAWDRFRGAVGEALALRDLLRERLSLPPVSGLRVCPVETIDAFLQDWGDRRGWRTHKGTDINAARDSRLVAMERGVIIQMGWHYLGGNQVYLLGDVTGDVYYYAHLDGYADGIEVGVPVIEGQVVGYVGDTGNADIPHLHLGWMPGTGRVDLDGLADPYPMLVELCH